MRKCNQTQGDYPLRVTSEVDNRSRILIYNGLEPKIRFSFSAKRQGNFIGSISTSISRHIVVRDDMMSIFFAAISLRLSIFTIFVSVI